MVVLALAVGLVVGAVGCGDDATSTGPGDSGTDSSSQPNGTTPDTGGDVETAALDGRAFVGTAVTEDGEPYRLAAGTALRLTFADGEVGADAGCNSMGGSYSVIDGVLLVDSIGQTEMACVPEARMEQDSWFLSLLTGKPDLVVDGDQLVLTAGTTVVTLTDEDVAEPDLPVVGTAWELHTVIAGGGSGGSDSDVGAADTGTASSTEAGIVLTLDPRGGFVVTGSCALAPSGTYLLGTDPDVVAFSLAPADVAVCLRALTEAESALSEVLTAEQATYTVDAGRLTLVAGASGVGFRPQG